MSTDELIKLTAVHKYCILTVIYQVTCFTVRVQECYDQGNCECAVMKDYDDNKVEFCILQ